MFGFIRFFSFSNLAEIASTILSSTHLWMKRGLGGWSHRPWPRSGIPHPHSLCAAGRASKLSLSAQKKEKPFFLCHFLKGEIFLFAHYDYQVKTKIHYQGIFINYLKCFLTTFTISQTVQRQKVKVVLLQQLLQLCCHEKEKDHQVLKFNWLRQNMQ